MLYTNINCAPWAQVNYALVYCIGSFKFRVIIKYTNDIYRFRVTKHFERFVHQSKLRFLLNDKLLLEGVYSRSY